MGEGKRRKQLDPAWGRKSHEYLTLDELQAKVDAAIEGGQNCVCITASRKQAAHLQEITGDCIFELPVWVFVVVNA